MDARKCRTLLIEAVHGRRLGKCYPDPGSRAGRGPSFSTRAIESIDVSAALKKLAQPAFKAVEMNEHYDWIRVTGSGSGTSPGKRRSIDDVVLDEVMTCTDPVLRSAARRWRQRISARAVERLSPTDRELVMDVLREFQSDEQVEQDVREMSAMLKSRLTKALSKVPPYRRHGPDQPKIVVVRFAISTILARLSFRTAESPQVSPITYSQAQVQFNAFWCSMESTLKTSLAESLPQIKGHEYWREQAAMLSRHVRSAGTQRAQQAIISLAEIRRYQQSNSI